MTPIVDRDLLDSSHRMADGFIRDYRIPNGYRDDLYSAAGLALTVAQRRFDGTGNFTGYALRQVRWAIITELRNTLGSSKRNSRQAIAIKRPLEINESLDEVALDQGYDRFVDRDFILSLTEDPRTREILVRKLAGYTNDEIGEELGVDGSRIWFIVRHLGSESARDRSRPVGGSRSEQSRDRVGALPGD